MHLNIQVRLQILEIEMDTVRLLALHDFHDDLRRTVVLQRESELASEILKLRIALQSVSTNPDSSANLPPS